MSNNLYNILNNFNKVANLDQAAKQEQPQAKTQLQESMEQVLSEKYMGFEKVAAAAKAGGAKNPDAVAASIGRNKYGKKKFQKAAAQGKKLGESVKPDYLDLDRDGNTSEPMKQAAMGAKSMKETEWDEVEDDDQEKQDEGFFVVIGREEAGAPFIGMITKDGGKWRETAISGPAPYNWGSSYMSYLTPEDIMSWIEKDYGRGAQVDGPFYDEESANDHANYFRESAPPGAKAERMVKHIKKGYAKDGNLTGKEKSIAYATAWKAKKAGKLEENYEDNPVVNAITRRIVRVNTDLLAKYGPELVGNAIDEVAEFVGDVEEIGSSDVSGWVRHVAQLLGNMGGEQGIGENRGFRGVGGRFDRENDETAPHYSSKEEYYKELVNLYITAIRGDNLTPKFRKSETNYLMNNLRDGLISVEDLESEIRSAREKGYSPAREDAKSRANSQGVAEGNESSIKKKIQAKQDSLSLAREQRRAKGQRGVQGQREIKLQAEINRLNTELTQLKKQGVAEGRMTKGPGGMPLDRQGNPKMANPAMQKSSRMAKPASKLDLDKIWFDVTQIIGNIFPDGDPADYLPSYCRKHGCTYDDIRAAAKKNGYEDEYAYIDDLKSGDYGYMEGVDPDFSKLRAILKPAYEIKRAAADAMNEPVSKADERKTFKFLKKLANRDTPSNKPGQRRPPFKSQDVSEGDVKKTKSGTVHHATKHYTGAGMDDEPKVDAVKKGRGRPKKGANSETGEEQKWDTSSLKGMFGSMPKKLPGTSSVKHRMDETAIDKLIQSQLGNLLEGSIQGGVWTSKLPKSGQADVPAPQDIDGASAAKAPVKAASAPKAAAPKKGEKGAAVPQGVDEGSSKYDMEIEEFPNPAFGPDSSEDVPETIDVGVNYDYSWHGKYYPQTLEQPAEYPELEVTIHDVYDLTTGAEITDTVDMAEIEDHVREKVESMGADDDDGPDDEGYDRYDEGKHNTLSEMLRLAGLSEAKTADKDYDGDGKIESGKDEYLGSKIAAAKKSGKLKEATCKTCNCSPCECDEKLDECMSPLGGPAQSDMSGRMDISTNMSSDGNRSVTINASNEAAVQLMQMLKLAGLDGQGADAPHAPDAVAVVVGAEDAMPGAPEEVAEEKDERYHANTTPEEHVMPVQVQTKGGDGDVAGKEKVMRKHGYQFADNPLAMSEGMNRQIMREYEGIKVKR